jgi:hypothetical protein
MRIGLSRITSGQATIDRELRRRASTMTALARPARVICGQPLIVCDQLVSATPVAVVDVSHPFRRNAFHDGSCGYRDAFGQHRTSADQRFASDMIASRQDCP